MILIICALICMCMRAGVHGARRLCTSLELALQVFVRGLTGTGGSERQPFLVRCVFFTTQPSLQFKDSRRSPQHQRARRRHLCEMLRQLCGYLLGNNTCFLLCCFKQTNKFQLVRREPQSFLQIQRKPQTLLPEGASVHTCVSLGRSLESE